MIRHTKIIATLGPASRDPLILERLIRAGVNVFRLNFSHGTVDDHTQTANALREISRKLGLPVGILADLQGPKIRVGKFEHGKITLATGDKFILDARCELGNQERVGLDYKNLTADVSEGTVLLLDDGRIILEVDQVKDYEIFTTVTQSGPLSNNKGINRQGGGLSAPALTGKDMEDIKTAVLIGADFLAVSFPKTAADMYMAKQLMHASGGNALIIAKIERVEAVAALEEILDASDGLMVARGDLAVEVGDAAVPALQKRMIRLAREKNKLTITATQMMESMILAPVPTRAEVSDVANDVLDGTDAVMLSAETAAGKFPVETVESMARICLAAEKSITPTLDPLFLDRRLTRIDQSIAMSAVFTAYQMKAKAVATLTTSGSTALWMSRLNCGIPILALTHEPRTLTKMTLFRGVFALPTENMDPDRTVLCSDVEKQLKKAGIVTKGDLVVVSYGDKMGQSGGTNTLTIVRISG